MKLSPRRWLLLAAVSSTLLVSYAVAQNGVVTTRDGAVFEGDVREEQGTVIVKDRRGIETRISREKVKTIEFREDVELEYNRRYKELAPGNVAERIELAKFVLQQRRPDLARQVLLEALALDPNDREASSLYEAARSQIELDRKSRDSKQRAAAGEAAAPNPNMQTPPSTQPEERGERGGRLDRMLLSAEQINRIRQVEFRQGETGMTFKFENDVERRFAAKNGMSIAMLRQRSPVERFLMMREHNELELLKDVKLLRDPQALMEFKQKVQPILLTGCARSGCHNDSSGRSFTLLSNQGDSEAAAYTNFYVLATSKYPVVLSNAQVANLPLIDRTSPPQSLMLQYMLTIENARFPHPPLPNYKGVIRSIDEPRFRTVLGWIQDSLSPMEPSYGFERRAAAGPATAPTTEPAGPTTAPAHDPAGATTAPSAQIR